MDEQVLVQRLQARDEQAFEELITSYGPRLLRGARLLAGQVTLAEELVSDTFAESFFALPRYRADAPLFNWLYGIMLNKFRYHCRKHKRLVRLETISDLAGPEIPSGDKTGLFEHIPVCLSRISPEHRSVIILKYLEGKSTDEIAAILNIPAGTVKSRIHNALELIRKILNQVNLLPDSVTD